MKKVLCTIMLLLIVGTECRNRWSGFKDGPYDVGPLLDGFLVDVNANLHKNGLDSFNLNDFSLANATGQGVFLRGLDTLIRTGRATVANDQTVFLVNASLGLANCSLDIQRFKYADVSAPVTFLIKQNAFRIAYGVDTSNKINCTLTWSAFQLLDLDRVTSESTDPAFNNADLSKLFNTRIKTQLNKHFATEGFLKFLDQTVNPCKHMYDNPLAQLRRLVYIQ